MTLLKLYLTPVVDSYAVEPVSPVVAVALDGGASRARLDLLGAPIIVSVTWVLGAVEYDYLMAFYRSPTGMERGARPFLMDLVTLNSTAQEHTVRLIGDSLRLTGQSGLAYTVVARLEVTPPADTDEYDSSFIQLWPEYGEDLVGLLEQLEVLVNQSLPG